MRFQRRTMSEQGMGPFHFIPYLNVILLLLMYASLLPPFVVPASIHVQLPKAVTSDVIKDGSFTVSITGENLIYVEGRVLTVKELERALLKPENRSRPVLIRTDRRTSMGRVVDVWDLCRRQGIERINIAATH